MNCLTEVGGREIGGKALGVVLGFCPTSAGGVVDQCLDVRIGWAGLLLGGGGRCGFPLRCRVVAPRCDERDDAAGEDDGENEETAGGWARWHISVV